MQTIKVNLSQNSYEIKIGPGLLNQVGNEMCKIGLGGNIIIITNPTVNCLWGKRLKSSLEEYGCSVSVLEVPDGESYKSLEQAGWLYEQLSDLKVERSTPILALGGGVIGDLAGFVAATYMRGVPFIQVPTTLLAQVDSSTGGKVGVNHKRLKNTIGSFYQPRLVISDISTLETLPEDEFINGLAEVIKHSVILDLDLFRFLEKNLKQIKSKDEEVLTEVVAQSVNIKGGVVEKDEKDTGLRNILNYGHTVGHAIETVSDFRIKHGQAVALGIVAAGKISHAMGFLSQYEMERIENLLSLAGLRTKAAGLEISRVIEAMNHDKKKEKGKIRLIVIKSIGEPFICDNVNSSMIKLALEELT